MRTGSVVFASLLAVSLTVVTWSFTRTKHAPPAQVQKQAGPDTSPVCPWREPIRDLSALFPPATNYVLEPRIVTRSTVEIKKRLGRHMNADENPLRVHRVQHGGHWLGTVLVTRVKAEHGGIEIVIGVETNGQVRGILIQSQREPNTIAQAITNTSFLGSFAGKSVTSPLRIGLDLPTVSAEAHSSAQAIADGVRHQLIVLSYAELPREIRELGVPTNR